MPLMLRNTMVRRDPKKYKEFYETPKGHSMSVQKNTVAQATVQRDAEAKAPAVSMAERARSLEESSSSFWKPEEGDSLGGKLLSVETGVGENGTSRIITIEDEETKAAVSLWGSAVLDREFNRLNARPGDLVAIRYFGKRAAKGGKTYKAYAVDVVKQEFKDDIPF